MGFGHRVYKNYDPRATIIKEVADQVFEVTGRNPLLDIALELERIALADDYFVTHKLYPNVDFYSGIIYQAMGFPVAMFPVLFAIGRMPGWLAHWQEGSVDPEQKISRPRQIYVGETERHLDGRMRLTGGEQSYDLAGPAVRLAVRAGQPALRRVLGGRPGPPGVGVRVGESVLDLAAGPRRAGLRRAVAERLHGPGPGPVGRRPGPDHRAADRGRHRGASRPRCTRCPGCGCTCRSRRATTLTFTPASTTRPTSGGCSGRAAEALAPNWRHLPVGYHGRSGTVVLSGTRVPARAASVKGRTRRPEFGPSRRLDFEAEVGFVVGAGSPLGAGERGRVHRPRVRGVPGQRLVGPRHPGLGVDTARPVPGQVVRHLDLAVGRAARGAGARPGQPAAADPPTAALPVRRGHWGLDIASRSG